MFGGGASAYGYGGGHGPGAYGSAYGLGPLGNISYETNSKDPILQRARVFVGNIMTSKVGREEIIQLFNNYGKLLGVTVFKGYAFVQFSHGTEADLAVSALNGYTWNGAALDVKLAMYGQLPQKSASVGGTPQSASKAVGAGKRNKETTPQQEAAAKDFKRMKIEQNASNKAYAAEADLDGVIPHDSSDILDTLICGECRYVTHGLADFMEHRKNACKLGTKSAGEPDVLGCISCAEQFPTSWELLSHHNTVHMRPLFKAVSVNGTEGGGGAESAVKAETSRQ